MNSSLYLNSSKKARLIITDMGGLEASAPVLQNWRGRGLTLSKWFFSEKIPFFQKVIKKYVEYLARTLKKIPPADLTQGGGAMQSLENKKASLLLPTRERQHFRRCSHHRAKTPKIDKKNLNLHGVIVKS